MFPSMTTALEGAGVSRDDKFCMILDTPFVSGNSIINYFLMQCLKDQNVIFITLQHTWSHYCHIATKLGMNLRRHSEQGSVIPVEVLKMLPNLLTEENEGSNLFSFLVNEQEEHPLKKFYQHIKDCYERLKKDGKPVAIIIDNLTSFLDLGINVDEVNVFIRYCYNLVCNPRDKLVTLITTNGFDHSSSLSSKLAFYSTSFLYVKGLESGRSKDIHGQLKIYTRPSIDKGHKQSTLLFKLEEKDIKTFSPGLVSSVL